MIPKRAGLGMLLAVAVSTPALAADWSGAGAAASAIKNYGSVAVPVPAPVPVPIHRAQWYFRLDVGIGLGDDPGSSENGLEFGYPDRPDPTGTAPEPFGTRSSWFDNDFDTFVTWGGGVGYYWSDHIRTDVTGEARTDAEVHIDGVETWRKHDYSSGLYAPTTPPTQVNQYTSDDTSLNGGVVLFNAYYDFANGGPFTPYIGGGIGFAINELSRHHATRVTECPATSTPPCDVETQTNAYNESEKTHTVSLAAMGTAGFSYAVTDITAVDLNYRLLYIGGSDVDMVVNGYRSTVSIGDTVEHQLRAGLRFNVN
jgi:opacity protein-like surface antigen